MAELSPDEIDRMIEVHLAGIHNALREGANVPFTAFRYGVPEWVVQQVGEDHGLLDPTTSDIRSNQPEEGA